MKKLIFAVVVTGFLLAGLPVFAQEDKEKSESEFYYVNISLEKIYPYRAGYVVQYRKGINQMSRAYLPIEWFSSSASRGEIVTLPSGRAWPSLSVYYKNGEFSHVRLYVHHSSTHQTWGTIPLNVNIDSRFENTDDLQIQF